MVAVSAPVTERGDSLVAPKVLLALYHADTALASLYHALIRGSATLKEASSVHSITLMEFPSSVRRASSTASKPSFSDVADTFFSLTATNGRIHVLSVAPSDLSPSG